MSWLQSAGHAVAPFMSSWHEWKLFFEHSVSISHDALHLMVGTLVWILASLLSRRPLSSWRPWLWAFAIILWNEIVDLWVEEWPNPGQQYGETVKDLLLTMFVPTLILAAARMRPDILRAAPGRRARRGR